MKALIIGATGATGTDLVNSLLQDPYYTEVVIFVRHLTGVVRPKMFEVVIDFDKPGEVSESIKGDIFFSCLGTTLKAAGSKEKQRYIDYEIPLKFAEIAKRNGISGIVLLSAYGASATSKVFYSKIKGQLEAKIASLSFAQYIVFRPAMLLRKGTTRSGERIMAVVLKVANRLGILRKFRPLPTLILAEKLAKAPKVLGAGNHVIELNNIFGF